MGNNQTTKVERNAAREIDEKLYDSHIEQRQSRGLLLLGAGASGKSTLMKQMRQIWGQQFLVDERKSYTKQLWRNTIETMQILCKYNLSFTENGDEKCQINDNIKNDIINALKLKNDTFNIKICESFKKLWNDPGIQMTYAKRNKYYIMDNANYLFKNMPRFAKKDYVPSFDDICFSRGTTSGIVTETFEYSGVKFKVYDIGGQRNERKKWLGQFNNVIAIIYVMSLAGFNQVIYEDNKTNKFEESLNAYQKHMAHKSLKLINIILFLNKVDILDEMLTNGIKFIHPKYKDDGLDKKKNNIIYNKFI